MKDNSLSQLRKVISQKMSRNTQAALAAKLGITQAYLSMILNGKRKPKNAKSILTKIHSELSPGFHNN